MNILMVCLGNICRSPIAEEILRQKCLEIGFSVHLDSAGTANYHIGEAPDTRMITTARKFGYDIANLRARQFARSDFEKFDIIFAMDEKNKSDIVSMAKNELQKSKVHSFQDFAGVTEPDFVPDPYYGTQNDFDFTFRVVEQSAALVAEKLKNHDHESR